MQHSESIRHVFFDVQSTLEHNFYSLNSTNAENNRDLIYFIYLVSYDVDFVLFLINIIIVIIIIIIIIVFVVVVNIFSSKPGDLKNSK
jgi:hypothetical protein